MLCGRRQGRWESRCVRRICAERSQPALRVLPGKKCPECGNRALIRKDGCDFCTDCGYTGACG